MSRPLSIAVIQMNSTHDQQANLGRAEQWIATAAQRGAQLVALPELFYCLGTYPEVVASAEPIPGPLYQHLSQLAAQWGIVLCAGSVCERDNDGGVFNTSLTFDAQGQLLGKYRKIHLFDVNLPGSLRICEADFFTAGSQPCIVDSEFGKIGIATCFDIRFPELFHHYVANEVELILAPSAFTKVTGKDHWEVLLRARAIESQLFIAAPNQVGRHHPGLESHGHSMIVHPWGTIVSQAGGDGEAMLLTAIDLEEVDAVRQQIPSVRQRLANHDAR